MMAAPIAPFLAGLVLAGIQPVPPAALPPPAAASASAGLLARLAPPPGLARDGEVQVYPADRLSDYIDGAADAYRDYGVVETATAAFGAPGARLPRITIDLHRMTSPKGAFGIFASERGSKAEALRLGSGSAWQNGLLTLWRGPYYARFVTEASRDTTLAFAKALADLLPAQPDTFPIFSFFAAKGRLAHREGFAARRFLGIRGLDEIWTATYSDSAGAFQLLLRNNRPPVRKEDLWGSCRIEAFPTDKSPIELIDLENDQVLILFFRKMAWHMAGYVGPRPGSDRTAFLSEWVASLPMEESKTDAENGPGRPRDPHAR